MAKSNETTEAARMRIALGTVEVSDEDREAIAHFEKRQGPASREACREFIRENGLAGVQHAASQQRAEADE
jgi:hypothetical protein